MVVAVVELACACARASAWTLFCHAHSEAKDMHARIKKKWLTVIIICIRIMSIHRYVSLISMVNQNNKTIPKKGFINGLNESCDEACAITYDVN